MADWKETKLWLLLKAKPVEEAKTVQTMLETCMPNIQDILARGGTSPNDFTLHDADHSFRVAQRMVDITPEDVRGQLSTYELALLLLSAYLHDIGMTPERQKVRQHYVFLLTGEADKADSLNQSEQNEFQAWLDDEGDGVVPPLTTHSPTGEVLRRAEEIITYYARHKHNDWSGEWIEAHRDWFKGAYVSFTDDLIRVCKSHHYGYKELVLDQFNPHNVGGATVHLRYLAVLLRLADILEFDPERTPEVVLRHRDIASKSLIYWYKDHEVSITQDGNRLVAYARPREARMHRAIELMLDDIEKELRVCRTLADETHFENSPGIQEKLPHHWDLSGTLHREDVKPQNNRYEYINGAFRPDTRKILELLSGIELYGSPFVAVRELLQNAFDAVREQIAYQRLDLPDPNDATAVNALETLCNVTLKLEQSEDGFWLVCTDNGVGMTKDIINRYLLVSGSARRHEILELERRCKAQGFTLGRTGQFGIGVLSYFMLADKLELRTRRSQEAGSDEQTGWRFTTEGIGSFGELSRDAQFRRGTQIRLHLKREIIGNEPAQWYADLRDYLAETLRYLPCRFQLESDVLNCVSFSQALGWADVRERLTASVVNFETRDYSHPNVPLNLQPMSEQRRHIEREQEWASIREEARQCLKFHVETGDLPDNMGIYRLHLPYFDLPGGAALGFLRVQEEQGDLRLVKPEIGHYFVWNGRVQVSWKGMHVKSLRDEDALEVAHDIDEYEYDPYADDTPIQWLHTRHVFIEVDWRSVEAGRLAVDRNTVIITDKTNRSLEWLQGQANDICTKFIDANCNAVYHSVNSVFVNSNGFPVRPTHWLSQHKNAEQETLYWSPISYPATEKSFLGGPLTFKKHSRTYEIYTSGETCINQLPPLHHIDENDIDESYGCFDGMAADKMFVGVLGNGFNFVIPVWLSDPFQREEKQGLQASQFPPQWVQVYKAVYDLNSFRNQDHVLVRLWNKKSNQECEDWFEQSLDPSPHRDELLGSCDKMASWLRYCIDRAVSSFWQGLIERDKDFIVQAWRMLFPTLQGEAQEWASVCNIEKGRLVIITPDDWREIHLTDSTECRKYLPEVDAEWRVEIKKSDGNISDAQNADE